MSSRGNSMTLRLRNTINYVLLPFIVFLSKAVSSSVKCGYLFYRAVQRIARDETFGPSLTHSKQPIYVVPTFKKFKLEMQKVKLGNWKRKGKLRNVYSNQQRFEKAI